MTQTERVLKAARSYNGTCQADWISPTTPDGGPPITRVAARIQDLEERDYTFEILHDRHGTRVYRLVSGPTVEGDSRGAIPPGPASAVSLSRLFEVGPSQFGFGDEEKLDAA